MTNMSSQPLWLTHFIQILLVLEFQLTRIYCWHAFIRPILDPIFPLMSNLQGFMHFQCARCIMRRGYLWCALYYKFNCFNFFSKVIQHICNSSSALVLLPAKVTEPRLRSFL